MSKIIKWEPIESIPSILNVEKVVYGTGGLRIFLKEKKDSDMFLKIHFKYYLGVRIFGESYRLKTIADNDILTSSESPSTLFVSENDELIEWLKEESLNIVDDSRNIKNYIVSTVDEIIDIISEMPPIVEWVHKGIE